MTPANEKREIDLLTAEKRRSERALARLQNLLLYGDSGIAEKDYIMERKRIIGEIASIDARLEELEKDHSSHFSISDTEFIEKIDYFILSQELMENER